MQMKRERGITLTGLIIYVVFFTAVLALVVNLSSYVYTSLGEVNTSSMSSEEFNKFNTCFVEDVKEAKAANITTDESTGNVSIVLSTGVNYNYIDSERAIYRNYEKIADSIMLFSARKTTKNKKNVIRVFIGTGKYVNGQVEFGKTINYVLKYW